MAVNYLPEAGDVVWIHFDPQTGHEQAGHRPALVLTGQDYNVRRGMMVCVPLTSKIKGNPFEVIISRTPPSAVLSDHIKNFDWRARGAIYKSRVTPQILDEVRRKIKKLLSLQ